MNSPSSDKQSTPQRTNRTGIPLRRKILFSVIPVLLFFGVLEGMLRLVGFQANQGVERMEFTFPIDDYNESAPQPFLVRDETLFWRPKAGVMDHNSKGFYGPEFETEKKTSVFRIVCLGDSCTHFGPDSYPDMLRIYLDETAPGKFEVINAGVIGYTSFQGRRLLESEVLKWSPDLVTVYFGWNDHWLARGRQDKDQNVETSVVMNALQGFRVIQFASYTLGGLSSQTGQAKRVELDDYRENLAHIATQCQSQNIATWYITAPHAFDLGIPPYLVKSGEISDQRSLIPMHRSYNQVVREVAQTKEATLIDLAGEMDRMNKQELFIDDHIHLSRTGKFYLTKRIIETLETNNILAERPNAEPSAPGTD
ncbi:GDSL-type esterase/lipase family protein [Rhodopirellula sp. JC740]|uniref:GDSL-type esterase/lipase family protein n=1 Tax=Rhodopirellula halodulae TaxID=2894198 RepID=A0ABS8NFZ4_9BACT|nr:GDSL-type esterase/lipase family protein [Rhodopirellula sp. JC740]MCC9642467.1 GDSL-type esterase/lipase family protein [Rhodopirellula sp. JC740]